MRQLRKQSSRWLVWTCLNILSASFHLNATYGLSLCYICIHTHIFIEFVLIVNITWSLHVLDIRKELWKSYFSWHIDVVLSELVHVFGRAHFMLVHVSVPAVVCLLSSLLSHSCIILWLSHQIWRIGLAKLLSADSSLYATESTSIPVRAQICQCVSTKMCDVHLSSLCACACTRDSSPPSLPVFYFVCFIPFWLTLSFIRTPPLFLLWFRA